MSGVLSTDDGVLVAARCCIVVPTRERCEKIVRCLAALDRQTVEGFEVVVVVDGSTDDTLQTLRELQDDDGRRYTLRVLSHERPQGANPARNAAVRSSDRDVFAFLDDDCIPEPPWLERLLAGFDSPRVAAVTGLVINVERPGMPSRFLIGQHRVASKTFDGRAHAGRLVAGNMAVRRDDLPDGLSCDLTVVADDMATSAGCDEEKLYLDLRAAGREVRFVEDAVVLHDHPLDWPSFVRQAFRGGCSTAQLVRRYGLRPRYELVALLWSVPLLLAALPCLVMGRRLPAAAFAAVGLASFGLFFAAVTYNEFARKRKTLSQYLLSLPALLVYYAARLAGYETDRAIARFASRPSTPA